MSMIRHKSHRCKVTLLSATKLKAPVYRHILFIRVLGLKKTQLTRHLFSELNFNKSLLFATQTSLLSSLLPKQYIIALLREVSLVLV